MIRTYEEALSYLRSREKFGIKFGLTNIDQIASGLGRPERQYPTVLIAGTNGKGSTAAILSSILTAAGRRTGRYTSPHIRFLEERIQVDGVRISQQELAASVARVAAVSAKLNEPTFFEAVTATAFAHFAERQVDLAVLEVGMGGRWDATNIAPAAISVITPIGLDHEHFLGDSIEAIAAEKAAIIKPNRPVIVGKLTQAALDVVRGEANRNDAELVRAADDCEIRSEPADSGQAVWLKTPVHDYGRLEFSLLGEHQLDNLVLAVRVAERLLPEVRVEHVRRGVAATLWPGRLQRIEGEPSLVLDAAHNMMAAEQLARFLEAHPHERRVLLFGVMKDKRAHEMLAVLLPQVTHFIATRPAMSRARGPEPLASFSRKQGIPAQAVASSREGLARARELAGPAGEVVVAGSIFLLGEVVEALEANVSGASVSGADRKAAQTPA